ncbi:MAG: TIGR02453 family protein [Actinobacteria bacterium 13_2_20CM_2_72_6]|nr:MAG: TIGR02453 family protein [Actinobacteria bacterium 13_2_20CM_2_72_6]
MAFRGWPTEALEFYEGLEADNSKTFWLAHKEVYEKQVLAPMTELLAELEPEFGAGKIFRPYRDVRFSVDKSPYKTAMGATLELGGYVQFSARGLAAGSGRYHLEADELDRYRKAVADDATGAPLAKLVAALNRKGIETAAHDSLKTVPRGYPKDHPRAELLRGKGLIAWKEWPAAAWMETAAAKKRVVDFLRAARALRDWLDANLDANGG